jgi:hypothetical protein
MERWSLLAGLIVVVGLLIESGPELAHSLIYLEWPSRGVIGNLVVVLGVAGEVLFSWRAVRAARQAELQAEHQIAELNAAVSAANERAANAEKAAAEANLARVKIEEKLREKFNWRTLDVDARHELIVALLPYAGFRIDIFAFSKSTEVLVLGDMLLNPCRHAGCKCKMWVAISDRLRISGGEGVVLAFAADATPEENETMAFVNVAVATALQRSKIRYSIAFGGFRKTDSVEFVPSPAPSVLPWDPNDVAPFRIQIIEKPLLDHNWPVTPPQA